MRNTIWLTIAAFALFIPGTFAQNVPPGSTPEHAAQMRQEAANRAEANRISNQINEAKLRSKRDQLFRGKTVPGAIAVDVKELYRTPTSKELKSLQVLSADLVKFKNFLSQKRTGMVRLVEDAGCGDSTKTLSAADDCIKYSMPGHGSSYSFRESNYRIRRLADLHFSNGNFMITGVLQHGILAGIGDIPLDNVDVNSRGLEPLNKFEPVTGYVKAAEIEQEMGYGWETNSFYYSRQLRAVDPMTYVLRSVAYRGNLQRSIGGVVYNELAFDKRIDITVAFRIIRRHEDGSITILWKELSRKNAPKIRRDDKMDSNEKNNKSQWAYRSISLR